MMMRLENTRENKANKYLVIFLQKAHFAKQQHLDILD